ncbi:MAG: hypothetical protein HUJ98_00960 [Bacteroidaceae bacterium]|nr:hypothetical protein [Bacteroidaceae bacterium]
MAYSSKYYDPDKAHQYYEEHKNLKGKHSTKGMTQEQKNILKYGKYQMNLDKKAEKSVLSEGIKGARQSASADAKSEKEQVSSEAKAQRERFTNQCKQKVDALKEKLKNMTKEEKALYKERIQSQIQSIKDSFSRAKQDVSAEASAQKQQISAENKAYSGALTEYGKVERKNINEKYVQQYDQLYNQVKAMKPKKSKKKK